MSNPWDVIPKDIIQSMADRAGEMAMIKAGIDPVPNQICQMSSDYDSMKDMFHLDDDFEFVIPDFIRQQKAKKSLHDGHEVVENQALGKKFLYCRDCKKEVE